MNLAASALTPQRKRLILTILWIAFFTAYLDRTNISIAGPTLMKSLAIPPDRFGYILAAFMAGYALTQIPAGFLADRFGVKPMLVIALSVWSIFTGLTGLATSLTALLVVRFLFGIGEGLESGAHFKALADTFDSRERSSASGIFHSALALGPALVAPVATAIIAGAGWQALFFWFTVPGVLVAILVMRFLPVVTQPATAPVGVGGNPLAAPGSWSAFSAYLLFNVAFWGFLGWMPSYLAQTRHIELKSLGFLASVPYLCGFVGLLAIGFLARGPFYRTRATLVAACYVLAGVGLFVAFRAHDVASSVAGLSLAAFFLYGTFGPFWAIVLDSIPENIRGAFATFVNFGGQIGGFFAPIVVGKIVASTGSYTGGFVFMIVAVLCAAVAISFTRNPVARESKPESLELVSPGPLR